MLVMMSVLAYSVFNDISHHPSLLQFFFSFFFFLINSLLWANGDIRRSEFFFHGYSCLPFDLSNIFTRKHPTKYNFIELFHHPPTNVIQYVFHSNSLLFLFFFIQYTKKKVFLLFGRSTEINFDNKSNQNESLLSLLLILSRSSDTNAFSYFYLR